MSGEESEMVGAIHRAREAQGRRALRWDVRLANAARGHAEDMRRNPGMVHVGSDGSQGGERMLEAGYRWERWGEVVGWGFGAEEMVRWWLHSGEHAVWLLAGDVEDFGVGFAPGPFWVVNFGREEKAGDGDDGNPWGF